MLVTESKLFVFSCASLLINRNETSQKSRLDKKHDLDKRYVLNHFVNMAFDSFLFQNYNTNHKHNPHYFFKVFIQHLAQSFLFDIPWII